jgi:hypothetical protein
MVFAESLNRPMQVDVGSCDFNMPLRTRRDFATLRDTSGIRDCYRSRRILLSKIQHTNKAITVFLHGADDLVYGCARVTLFRKRSATPATGDVEITGSAGDDVYVEMSCITRSMVRGAAVGTVVVAGEFDSMSVTVMQPCTGITVHVVDPLLNDKTPIPTVGLSRA